MATARLCAVRVERRAVAIAILSGDHLEFVDSRKLSSSPDKAIANAASFIGRTIEKFSFETAALEEIPNAGEVQRTLLQRAVISSLSEKPVGLWIGPKLDILGSFGCPPLTERK